MQAHTDPIDEKKKEKIWKMRGRIYLDKSSERMKTNFKGVIPFKATQRHIWTMAHLEREARTSA